MHSKQYFGEQREILVACAHMPSLNANANVSREAVYLIFSLIFHLHAYWYKQSAKALVGMRIRTNMPELLLM